MTELLRLLAHGFRLEIDEMEGSEVQLTVRSAFTKEIIAEIQLTEANVFSVRVPNPNTSIFGGAMNQIAGD